MPYNFAYIRGRRRLISTLKDFTVLIQNIKFNFGQPIETFFNMFFFARFYFDFLVNLAKYDSIHLA